MGIDYMTDRVTRATGQWALIGVSITVLPFFAEALASLMVWRRLGDSKRKRFVGVEKKKREQKRRTNSLLADWPVSMVVDLKWLEHPLHYTAKELQPSTNQSIYRVRFEIQKVFHLSVPKRKGNMTEM